MCKRRLIGNKHPLLLLFLPHHDKLVPGIPIFLSVFIIIAQKNASIIA